MFTNKIKIPMVSHGFLPIGLRFSPIFVSDTCQGRLQSRRRGESRESMDHICLLPGVAGWS